MHKRKRIESKESNKLVRRVPLGAVQTLNCTQDLRIPTYHSTELKSIHKSFDLRKPGSTNPYKKTVSRKSTCKSVKQSPSCQIPKLKTLMKQFKQLKLMHQNQRSKSKSPASCKSRSVERHLPKKSSFGTFGVSTMGRGSEPNLTVKLQRTIKKLNQSGFFQEDSLIAMGSSSDMLSERREGQIVSTQRDEIVDLREVREFCSTAGTGFRREGLAFESYTLFKETMAAVRIQRAWKNYQTKRLISRYTFLFQHSDSRSSHNKASGIQIIQALIGSDVFDPMPLAENLQTIENNNWQNQRQVVFDAEQCYRQDEGNSGVEVMEDGPRAPKIRHISNLQEQVQSASSEYEEVVKRMKIEQLQKWNQIISIIASSKNEGPLEMQKLLQKLAKQSQINKKDLEQKTKKIGSSQKKKHRSNCRDQDQGQILEREDGEKESGRHCPELFPSVQSRVSQSELLAFFHNRNQSGSSQALEQYDSKKYIQYLDGDVFASEQGEGTQNLSVQNLFKQAKISRHKQEVLLHSLEDSNLPIRLGQETLYHSESVEGLSMEDDSREGLRRSASQKSLKKRLTQSLSEMSDDQEGQINLDVLARQFLQGSDPSSENLDMMYSEEKLRSKLAELKNYREQVQDALINQNQRDDILLDDMMQKRKLHKDQDEGERHVLQRSKPVPQILVRPPQIRIEQGEQSPQRMKVQHVQAVIDSDSDEDVTSEQEERLETVAAVILNTLMMEVLKEVATHEKMTQDFKKYSLGSKPKVRKSEGGKKKKGFPTSKAQIQLFLQGLIKYLNRQQPLVFHNLNISTGPSALQMLRYMHQGGDQSIQSQQNDQQDQSNVMVIPNRVFDSFWSLKEKSIIIQIPQNYDQTNSIAFRHQFQLLKSFNKIFYRSLFDSFNECLDWQRNFGQYGRPFPWKQGPQFQHKKKSHQIKVSIDRARRRMLQHSITYCGLIVQNQQRVTISQEYIGQVHEDRLSRMLASDLVQSEQRWIFYDDEETEILVQIANAIYTQMLIEVIESVCELG